MPKRDPLAITVRIPYTLYKVPTKYGDVDLRPNAVRRLRFSRSNFPFIKVREAETQLKSDGWAATKEAVQSMAWYPSASFSGPVVVSITIMVKQARNRDADGVIAALKPCFDGIASALGCDDSAFQFGPVEFVKGEPGMEILLSILTEGRVTVA